MSATAAKKIVEQHHTSLFTLWVYEDGTVDLLPPPQFVTETVRLYDTGVIKWNDIDTVMDEWLDNAHRVWLKYGAIRRTERGYVLTARD